MHDTYASSVGKFRSGLKNVVAIEYDTFLAYAASRIHPLMRSNAGALFLPCICAASMRAALMSDVCHSIPRASSARPR